MLVTADPHCQASLKLIETVKRYRSANVSDAAKSELAKIWAFATLRPCGTAFTSMDVKAVLKATFKTNGVPTILRSDNGPEFIAHDLGEWLAEQGVIRKYIDPGKPWQNGIAESFHSRFRDELLNVEVFSSPSHAQVLIDAWRAFYNSIRPHSSLGYRTPHEFTALHAATQAATTAVHSP